MGAAGVSLARNCTEAEETEFCAFPRNLDGRGVPVVAILCIGECVCACSYFPTEGRESDSTRSLGISPEGGKWCHIGIHGDETSSDCRHHASGHDLDAEDSLPNVVQRRHCGLFCL